MTIDDERNTVTEVLKKKQKLSAEDLHTLRNNTGGVGLISSKTDYFMFRIEVELIDAIRALDETSTELINKTNKLTTVILVLTGVGIFIAAVGVLIALLQLFKK